MHLSILEGNSVATVIAFCHSSSMHTPRTTPEAGSGQKMHTLEAGSGQEILTREPELVGHVSVNPTY